MFWGYQRRGWVSRQLLCPTGQFIRWSAARRDEGRYAPLSSTVPVNRGATRVLGLVVRSSTPVSSGRSGAVSVRTVAATAPAVVWLFDVYASVRGPIWLERPPVIAHVGRESVSHELSNSAS